MKGKRGPKPATKEEIEDQKANGSDLTIEVIVGEDNVVDVGSPLEEKPPEALPHMQCANCSFKTHYLSEMEEHAAGTGHGRAPVSEPAQQLGLPGIVRKEIRIPLPEDMLNDKRKRLALLYQSALEVREEKRVADADFNARLKNVDEQMQEIARLLRSAFTYELVNCEWRIIEGENARGLYRLDTGELVEKQALAAEDREAEMQTAAAENSEPVSEQTVEEVIAGAAVSEVAAAL